MRRVEKRYLIWLAAQGKRVAQVTPLQGDVSPRRYFRILDADGSSCILAAYPAVDRAASGRFLATTRSFEVAGIRVPRVLASDTEAGLILLEDLGTLSLFDLISGPWSILRPHLETAIALLTVLAARPASEFTEINPPLDAGRLSDEVADAREVFLDAREFSGDRADRRCLCSALDELVQALAAESLVPSHRDFMSRNLMLPSKGSAPAVIDHQDACLAPRFYDLASLLNDSLFLSPSQERTLLRTVAADGRSLHSYRRCAVQRTLKATATFVKFAFKGSTRLLPLVAPTLGRAAYQLERLPEGKLLAPGTCDRWRDLDLVTRGVGRLLRRSAAPMDPTTPAGARLRR